MRFNTILLFFAAALALPVSAAKPPLSVDVINTPDQPIPVTVVEDRQPVNFCQVFVVGGGGQQFLYSVPADKRLTMEFASIKYNDGSTDNDDSFMTVSIKTTVNGAIANFHLGKIDISGDSILAADSRQVKISADPGTEVQGGTGSRNCINCKVEVCIAGVLEAVDD